MSTDQATAEAARTNAEDQARHPLVRAAADIADRAHRGQVDKLGKAYIDHPATVAATLTSQGHPAPVIAAGWLHDVVEDTDWTLGDLAAELSGAGTPDQVADTLRLVALLTHQRGEPRVDYYLRIATSEQAVTVKAADIAHNTSPERMDALDERTRERLTAKYRAARTALGLALTD
ncbi:HD domain-containing protein [Cellulosimicrobium sp. Marseille-Q4280]|uniref:HD domain-containing protein n=1 Tax=Cellulosimicrobium sp. Marseille-Q4280 TaxID=2937992 RepID=UPI00203E0222|nr:HD domain-containing protein [Cellulosimicrobium sp. Marseille-Q4280]